MKFFYAALAVLVAQPSSILAQKSPVTRPPITGIAQVSVYDSNPSQSRQFYADLLGLSEAGMNTHPGGVAYQVGSGQWIEVDPLPKGVTDHLESITFATANVEQLRRYLLDQHVPVPNSVVTHRNGTRSLSLRDPEGHCIVFVDFPRPHLVVSSQNPAKPAVSRNILHAGFIVRDRAAENHFYRDVLGFRQAWQGGMKDNRTDFVDMQVPDGAEWIEYMLFGAKAPSPAVSGILNHFSLGVVSVHKAEALLEKRGWHPSDREKAQIGRDGKWQLNLYDPDGTRVELMEFRPVRKPCCSPYSLPERTIE